jgi:hypothetical protein
MTEDEYFNDVLSNAYIQEYCVGVDTQDDVVDCIIEAYPLPNEISRSDVADWVSARIAEYNDEVDEWNWLPTE